MCIYIHTSIERDTYVYIYIYTHTRIHTYTHMLYASYVDDGLRERADECHNYYY